MKGLPQIIDNLVRLNQLYLIKKTRYKQRNDFYSFFGFLKDHQLNIAYLEYIYKILVLIGPDISPSNDDCLPFQNYARNCVTQSNSRAARSERKAFFEALFVNDQNVPNPIQLAILQYYGIPDAALVEHERKYTLDALIIANLKPSVIFNA